MGKSMTQWRVKRTAYRRRLENKNQERQVSSELAVPTGSCTVHDTTKPDNEESRGWVCIREPSLKCQRLVIHR